MFKIFFLALTVSQLGMFSEQDSSYCLSNCPDNHLDWESMVGESPALQSLNNQMATTLIWSSDNDLWMRKYK